MKGRREYEFTRSKKPSLQEAKSQLEQARKQAQAQRELLTERRTEAEQARKQVEEQKAKIPAPSQRRLRSGLYAGLEGRKRRQLVGQAKEQLEKKEKEIGIFKTGLKEVKEKELVPFEQSISQRASEIKDYEDRQLAINQINKMILEDRWYHIGAQAYFGTGYKKKYAQEAMKRRDLVNQPTLGQTTISKPSAVYESQFLQQSFTSAEAKTKAEIEYLTGKTTNVFTQQKTPAITLSTPRDLPRTDLLKDFNPLKSINIPRVTGAVRDLIQRPFLTTGSPKRVTSLLNLETKRPPTPSFPIQPPRQPPRPRKRLPIKTKVEKKDLFFKRSKTKRNNFWRL